MAADYGELGFGLRAAKMTPLPSGTATSLPRPRQLDVNFVQDSATLTGGDATVAVKSFNGRVEGSFEAGGMNPAAIAIMLGGVVTATGTTPAAKKTISVTSTTAGGYWKLEAQVIADDLGDLHVIIYKGKCTSGPNWTFQGGEYVLTNADYTGVADATNKIFDLVFNETAIAIA